MCMTFRNIVLISEALTSLLTLHSVMSATLPLIHSCVLPNPALICPLLSCSELRCHVCTAMFVQIRVVSASSFQFSWGVKCARNTGNRNPHDLSFLPVS